MLRIQASIPLVRVCVLAGSRSGWREMENGMDGDWEDGSGRGTVCEVPISRSSRPPWEDKDGHLRKPWDEDNLPEW